MSSPQGAVKKGSTAGPKTRTAKRKEEAEQRELEELKKRSDARRIAAVKRDQELQERCKLNLARPGLRSSTKPTTPATRKSPRTMADDNGKSQDNAGEGSSKDNVVDVTQIMIDELIHRIDHAETEESKQELNEKLSK